MNQKTSQIFQMHPSWELVLKNELKKPYISDLQRFVCGDRKSGYHIYPNDDLVFNAFNCTPFDQVRVLIMGQDPYHGPGQAHGLSFSVPNGVAHPPSLKNIFKELSDDLGIVTPKSGNLLSWAKQGVLLLNATLTVREGEPLSHAGKGWERFTDAVVYELTKRKEPLIFVLWGRSAKEKVEKLDLSKHSVFTAPHPSPLSAHRGFFGCKHFSKVNKQLEEWRQQPINWSL